MKSTFPSGSAANNVYPDGSIRCPWAFHAVLPDPDDQVVFRVRVLIGASHATRVPAEAIGRVVRDALRAAGIEAAALESDVMVPEHDCATMAGDSGDSVTA